MRTAPAAAIAITVILFGSILLARPGVVITTSGQRYEGDVNERADDVIITIRGVQTTLNRGEVSSIEYGKAFREEFAERMAALKEDDAAGHVALAKWAMSQGEYPAARDALEAARAIDPNNAEAVEILQVVRGQIRLHNQQAERIETGNLPTPPGEPKKRALLTDDDIQAIRRAEWKGLEDGVRLRVDPKIARQFADANQIKWQDFARKSAAEQARMMLESKDEAFMQGVTIMSDPVAIAEFKRFVSPVLLSGCATSGCHGGGNAGRFVLVQPADNDAAVYTNYYLMARYAVMPPAAEGVAQQAGGSVFGNSDTAERRMILRGSGARSLLLQYGLPRDIAEFDHPEVPNYTTPVFQSLEDPRARPIIRWIERTLPLNPGDTGIEFTLAPPDPPSTRPANTRGGP